MKYKVETCFFCIHAAALFLLDLFNAWLRLVFILLEENLK
jgi:hypothetical protein